MNPTEWNNFEKKYPEGDGYFLPPGPEMPLIHVKENKESGLFEGSFDFDLLGVGKISQSNEGKEGYIDRQRAELAWAIEHMTKGLTISQRIDFTIAGGMVDFGSPSINLNITASAKSDSPKRTTEEAIRFYENIMVVLKGVDKYYRFDPVTNRESLEEDREGYGWKATIVPHPFRVRQKGNRNIGFLSAIGEKDSKSILVTPQHVRRKPLFLNSIVKGIQRFQGIMKLKISLIPVILSEEEQKAAEAAICMIRRGNASIEGPLRTSFQQPEDFKTCTMIVNSLAMWCKNPTGLRIGCEVFSEKPLPDTLLKMLGAEIFQESPLYVRSEKRNDFMEDQKRRKDDISSSEILDLSGCLNSDIPLPFLLPDPSQLAHCGIERIYTHRVPEMPATGNVVGYVRNNGQTHSVRLSKQDRSRHCYVMGATGTGKSTLLYNMIMEDISNGEGVTVIDPHGDLYNQVLTSIPRHRVDDVVLIDPCDFDYAVGINFLECSNTRLRNVEMNYSVNEMIKIFDRLYDLKQTGGPIFEQYMRNALLLAMDSENEWPTLMDIPFLFENSEYREYLKKKCKNPLVTSFWGNQVEKAFGDAKLENITPYITSKLNQFTTNALIRPIISQSRSTVNFRTIMDEGRIVLVNLSKGLIGELDSQLLGMLIIGKLFSAAMGRVVVPPEDRRPMFLYVDEFQNFTTDSVAYLISEARKFGIYLTLANQNLSQLSQSAGKQNILDSVLGNIGTFLLFRMGVVDSEKLQIYTKPELQASDLQEIPDFHVAGRLLIDGIPKRPFVFKTFPPPPVLSDSVVEEIVEKSRKRYATPTAALEKEILARYSRSNWKPN